MWLQRFTRYLLNNRFLTIIFTFLISFVPVVGILGIIIAAFVTLTQGVLQGAILTFVATLAYAISTYLSSLNDATVPIVVWWLFGGIIVLSNLVTWIFSIMLRRKASWVLILEMAALLGVLVVSVVHLVNPNIVDWWATILRPYFDYAQNLAGAGKGSATDTAVLAQRTALYSSMTGLLVAVIMTNGIVQLIVARWWQSVMFDPKRLSKELHHIRLSQLAGILFIISVVLTYIGNSVVLDIMPVLYVLFGAAGLSLIHFMADKFKTTSTWFWLAILYVTLIFSLPVSNILIMLIATLALADIWLDLRKRFKN